MREKCFGDWMAGADLRHAVYSIAVGLLALHRRMQWNNFHPRCKSAARQPGHSSNPKTFQLRTIAALPEPAGRPTHGLSSRRSTNRISTSLLANFAQLSMFRFDGLNIQNVFLSCNTKCIIGGWFCDNKLYSKVIYFCALVLETKNRGVRIHLALTYL